MEREHITIYCLGFLKDEIDSFEARINVNFKTTKCIALNSDKEVKNLSQNSIILVNGSKKYNKSNLVEYPLVLYVAPATPIDQLSDLLELNVLDILTEMPSEERVLSLMTKISINLLFHQHIPFAALEHITKSSIKVRNHNQLKDYLVEYFDCFEDIAVKSFFIKEDKQFSYLHGESCKRIEEFIDNTTLEERPIGSFFEFEKIIALPVNIDGNKTTWLCIESDKSAKRSLVDLFFIHLGRIELYRNLKKMSKNLLELSLTDEVTGLYNQRKLAEDLAVEVDFSLEQNLNFSLLFVDIDHFKKVNDSHGHIIGSNMLKQLGEVLKQLVRSTDTVYRYGGDEFIVLMRKTKTQTVYHVASRILEQIRNTEFKIDDKSNYSLSVSIGIAEYPADASSPKEIVEFADQMMYKSKDSGRGKVFHVKEISS